MSIPSKWKPRGMVPLSQEEIDLQNERSKQKSEDIPGGAI